MRKKVLLVVRVSSDAQDTESQKEALKNHLIKKGLDERDFIYEEEEGASAIKLNDKYLNLISRIKSRCLSGEVGSVALWHLNRLGRKEGILVEMKEFFVQNKIQVYIKEPDITLLNEDGTEKEGIGILWSMFAITITGDTKELKEKTKRGMEWKKSKGLYIGGTVKYGYRVNSEEKVVVNEEEANIIRDLRKLYSTGNYSQKTLFQELRSRGIKIRGKLLSVYTIENCLSDSFSEFSDTVTNSKIKLVKESNNTQARKNQAGKKVYLGSKLIKCPCCSRWLGYNKGMYLCYRHTHQWKTPETICNFKGGIKSDSLDSKLWEIAKELDTNKVKVTSKEEEKELVKGVGLLEKKIRVSIIDQEKVLKRKDRVLDNYENGFIDEKERNLKLEKVKLELLEIERIKKSLSNQIEVMNSKLELIRTGKNEINYGLLSDEDKYSIIKKHIKEVKIVEVDRYHKKIMIANKYGFCHSYDYFSRGLVQFKNESIVSVIS